MRATGSVVCAYSRVSPAQRPSVTGKNQGTVQNPVLNDCGPRTPGFEVRCCNECGSYSAAGLRRSGNEALERKAAENFGEAAREAGVKRIQIGHVVTDALIRSSHLLPMPASPRLPWPDWPRMTGN